MQSKPNILVLLIDQQRFDTIHALGASHMHTPNMDRLVELGCTFTKAYSSCPVCMPARHDLLTGASARHHGFWVNADHPVQDSGLATLPRMLTRSGYQTIAVGKMHYFPVREHHGWAHMHLMEEIPRSREDDEYLQYLESVGLGDVASPHGVRPLFYHAPQVSPIPEEHHGTAWVANKTIELISQKRTRPFFMMSGWIDPHPPYSIPEKYLKMYEGAALPDPCPRPESEDRQYPQSDETDVPDARQLQRMREAYFASCTFVDEWVGKVLDALEANGQLDNTYIILTSDHGEMLGDRQAYQKFSPYEGSAHVPLIMAGPGIEPGSRSEIPATTWDVASTIAALSGADFPEDHPWVGDNLLAETDESKIAVFHHGGDLNGFAPVISRYVAAVDQRYKFVHYYNGGEKELYDLQDDPWEQNNLLADADEPPTALRKLRQACIDFELQHGQDQRIKDGAFVDTPYKKPAFSISKYFGLRFSQHPRWLTYHSKEDFETVINEMKVCLARDGIFLPVSNAWKTEAEAAWSKAGGSPELLQEFFESIEKR